MEQTLICYVEPKEALRRADLEAHLSDEEQQRVCGLLAQFKTPQQILTVLRSGGNRRATLQTVKHYRDTQKWQPLIERLREEYRARILDVPVANVRVRLDALQTQLDTLTAAPGTTPDLRREVREVLRHAREETALPSVGTVTVYNQIMQLSDEALEQRRQQVVARITHLGGSSHAVRESHASQGTGPSEPSPQDEAPRDEAPRHDDPTPDPQPGSDGR